MLLKLPPPSVMIPPATATPAGQSDMSSARTGRGRGPKGPARPGPALSRWALAVFLLSVAVYANTIGNDLVSDDREMLIQNANTHDPLRIKAIFAERYWGTVIQNDTLYRPLTIWTFALNYGTNRLIGRSGPDPVGYRALNVVLHAIVGCLLLIFLTRLGMPPAASAASALLFACHPIHTEAVASVVGRGEILAALFGILFLISHRDRRSPFLSGSCLLLALFSKESAVAFLPVAALMDAVSRARKRSGPWLSYVAGAAAVALWGLMRSGAVRGAQMVILPIDNPLVEAGLGERLLTAAVVQLNYLRLLLLPIRLSSDYSYNQIPVVGSVASASVLLYFLILLCAAALAWALRRRHPVVPLFVGGYAILFLPASNVLYPIGTIMGERLAYSPSLFFCAALGYGHWLLRGRLQRITPGLLALLLIAYAPLTVLRNTTWSTMERFARAQLASAPNSAKANYNAGLVEQEAGRIGSAADRYRRAIEILPGYPVALNNLGIIARENGDLEAAIGYYGRAIAARPTHVSAHFNLGQAYQIQGRVDLAAGSYETAIRLRPDYVQALSNLAAIRLAQGRADDAKILWERALAIDPRYETARTNLENLRRGLLK